MRTYIAIVLAGLAASAAQASSKPAAQAQAAKGPVQITLKLHDTTVKKGKSLWYKLELKNVGKRKFRVHDRIFRDPWVIHENCRTKTGLYIEVLSPNGKDLWVRAGGRMETWDYSPKPGGTKVKLTPEEAAEIKAVRENPHLSPRERALKMRDINDRHHERKQQEELDDPAKQLWLAPGKSTATLAWAYREQIQDEFTDHSDEEPQIDDFTQLWSYIFSEPGTYRVRAVYDHGIPEGYWRRNPEDKDRAFPPEAVKVVTPFINIHVLP